MPILLPIIVLWPVTHVLCINFGIEFSFTTDYIHQWHRLLSPNVRSKTADFILAPITVGFRFDASDFWRHSRADDSLPAPILYRRKVYSFQEPMAFEFPSYVSHSWRESGADISLRPVLISTVDKYIHFKHQWRSTFSSTCLIFGGTKEWISLRPLLNYTVGEYIYFRKQNRSRYNYIKNAHLMMCPIV